MGVVGWGKGGVSYVIGASQLRLAYSWARPAIRVEGECFYFFISSLSFIFLFLPCRSLSPPPLFPISLLPFCGRRHKMTQKGWCVVKPIHNQWLKKCLIGSYVYWSSKTESKQGRTAYSDVQDDWGLHSSHVHVFSYCHGRRQLWSTPMV